MKPSFSGSATNKPRPVSATGHVGFKTVAAPVPLARPGGRVLVLGRGGRGKTAGPVRLNAPKPLSLPSLKKENRGFDPTVAVVPTGSAGWGQPTGDSENYADADEDSAELQDASSQPARSNRMTERRASTGETDWNDADADETMDFSQPLNFGDTATAWRRPKTGDSQQQSLIERQHREQMESAEKERRLALAEKEYERKREAEIELARQQNRRLSFGDSNPMPSSSSTDDHDPRDESHVRSHASNSARVISRPSRSSAPDEVPPPARMSLQQMQAQQASQQHFWSLPEHAQSKFASFGSDASAQQPVQTHSAPRVVVSAETYGGRGVRPRSAVAAAVAPALPKGRVGYAYLQQQAAAQAEQAAAESAHTAVNADSVRIKQRRPERQDKKPAEVESPTEQSAAEQVSKALNAFAAGGNLTTLAGGLTMRVVSVDAPAGPPDTAEEVKAAALRGARARREKRASNQRDDSVGTRVERLDLRPDGADESGNGKGSQAVQRPARKRDTDTPEVHVDALLADDNGEAVKKRPQPIAPPKNSRNKAAQAAKATTEASWEGPSALLTNSTTVAAPTVNLDSGIDWNATALGSPYLSTAFAAFGRPLGSSDLWSSSLTSAASSGVGSMPTKSMLGVVGVPAYPGFGVNTAGVALGSSTIGLRSAIDAFPTFSSLTSTPFTSSIPPFVSSIPSYSTLQSTSAAAAAPTAPAVAESAVDDESAVESSRRGRGRGPRPQSHRPKASAGDDADAQSADSGKQAAQHRGPRDESARGRRGRGRGRGGHAEAASSHQQ